MKRRDAARALALAPLAGSPLAWSGLARAQPASPARWSPGRPVRLMVGFAPGGSTDISARLIADAIAAPLGQPVVVENRVGAAGNLASEAVARSAPDGHTFVVASVGTPATRRRMEELGYLPAGGSAAEMARLQRDDVILMERLVRLTGAASR
ncbi:Bug family tripartite tricarboxylate transporter substrate binding protein [Pseudoroseomonas sp. WGS1072]|uniref:Bug family tripartite tricarboxylate transporter substrate binding protein n=1 Tax=Roseomonas sp. WGS1072 TaxID=3366816 RepID=UPI003BF17CAC